MPKRRKNELVRCRHFTWRLFRLANGIWQADGRSNVVNAGRHSLGTDDYSQAIQLLHELDAVAAADHGLIERPITELVTRLSLDSGRKLYEAHLRRPRELGGVKAATTKRYRAVFDKFEEYCRRTGVVNWNDVTNSVLIGHATAMRDDEYAGKTLRHELTVIVQAQKWLIAEKHLIGVEQLRLSMRKVEGQRAYCYTREQVQAMVDHCAGEEDLQWIGAVIITLAYTGMRISELISLRWADVDFDHQQIILTDESGRAHRAGQKSRELKSGRSRKLPLHPSVAETITKLGRQGVFVFYGPLGGRPTADSIRRTLIREVIKPLARRFADPDDEKGFSTGRLHSFRHFFASSCANAGVPEPVLQTWLGHRASEMTRHYYHLHDSESKRQIARLDSLSITGTQLAGARAATEESESTKPERT